MNKESMREAIRHLVGKTRRDARAKTIKLGVVGGDADTTVDKLMELFTKALNKERQEMLERLLEKKEGFMDGGAWEAVPVEIIEEELKRVKDA